jgi:subtilisin family serine protease
MNIGIKTGTFMGRYLPFLIVFIGLCLIGTLNPGRILAASVQGLSGAAQAKAGQVAGEIPQSAAGKYVEGELLIKYKEKTSGAARTAFAQRHSLEEVRRFKHPGMHHVRIPRGSDMAAYLEQLRSDKNVEYAEPNYKRKPLGTVPNDLSWDQQWEAIRIKLPDAWDYIQASQGVVVAVVDTGVDYNHRDLAANMWKNAGEVPDNHYDDDGNEYIDDVNGWNFYSNNNDPMDTYSHGTHVAGIIGAVGNNSLGVAGVNWRARIMPVKFMDANGGDVASEIEAIEYAVDMGAKIINASFGDNVFSQAEYDAIQSAGEKGVLFVAAAGNDSSNNDGSTKNYPASYNLPNIISVAASDSNYVEGLASFSNYGATSVHLAAPGDTILSTIPEGQSNTSVTSLTVPSTPNVQYNPTGIEYAGPIPSGGITGTLWNCGYGYSNEFPSAVAGNIALIKRGSPDGSAFYFYEKLTNAQAAGAVAAIVYNNVSGNFSGTLGSAGEWIPAVSISLEEGETLLALGNPVVNLANSNYPYSTKSGTSMATPFVSGVAALLWAESPDATVAQIKQAILESVDALPSLAGKVATGGRLNAYKALQKIASIAQNQKSLKTGWNFVSFPRLPSTSVPVETVLADVSSNVLVVWSYDNQEKRWLKWKPSDSAPTLTSVTADKGYWIYMTGDGAIDTADWLDRSQSITLYNGWNLIGYGGASGKKVASAFDAISDNWNIIWSWDGVWYGKSKAVLDLPLPLQQLTDMAMGKAYWIKVTRANSQIQWTQ